MKAPFQPGQHTRELNPYWKDGGSGVPEEKKDSKSSSTSSQFSKVGDGGLGWLRKAYQRVVQQDEDEKRPLEELAAERWGSLDKIQAMLAEGDGSRRGGDRRDYDSRRGGRGDRRGGAQPRRAMFLKPSDDDDGDRRHYTSRDRESRNRDSRDQESGDRESKDQDSRDRKARDGESKDRESGDRGHRDDNRSREHESRSREHESRSREYDSRDQDSRKYSRSTAGQSRVSDSGRYRNRDDGSRSSDGHPAWKKKGFMKPSSEGSVDSESPRGGRDSQRSSATPAWKKREYTAATEETSSAGKQEKSSPGV